MLVGNTLRRRRATVILAGALIAPLPALVAAPAYPAPAGADTSAVVLSAATDRQNDVRSTRWGKRTTTKKQRQAIDLRRVAIAQRGESVLVTVRIKKLAGKKAELQQMFFVSFRARGQEVGQIGFTHRRRDLHYAYTTAGQNCEIDRVRRAPKRNEVTIVVPTRCAATTPGARPVVTALLGIFRSDAPVSARDRLRMPRI